MLALLAGNAVFLFLGFSHLFLVIDRWATDFGLRCAQVFSTFVGPIGLGLPIAALLLATHVAPMIRRARLVLIVVLSELGVSALFGAITFLGGFAHDLSSARNTIENTLWRAIWLAFLVLAGVIAVRLWMGLYPSAKPGPGTYGGYGQPSYGRPYPGQPLYPQDVPNYPAGAAAVPGQPNSPAALSQPIPVTGWPIVPPPPRPEPLVVPTGDLTQHLPTVQPASPTPAPPESEPAAGKAPEDVSNGIGPAVDDVDQSAVEGVDQSAVEAVDQSAVEDVDQPTAAPAPARAEAPDVSSEPPTQQIQR